jgi:hypothetical protein
MLDKIKKSNAVCVTCLCVCLHSLSYNQIKQQKLEKENYFVGFSSKKISNKNLIFSWARPVVRHANTRLWAIPGDGGDAGDAQHGQCYCLQQQQRNV